MDGPERRGGTRVMVQNEERRGVMLWGDVVLVVPILVRARD